MSHVQSKRVLRAYEIKQNDTRDKVVIVTRAGVTSRSRDGSFYFVVDHVDECDLLAQVNYSPSIGETDDLGQQFLLLKEASHLTVVDDQSNRAKDGSLRIFVISDPRDDLPYDTTPYFQGKGKERRLVLPEAVYEDMYEKRGQYIFLDKDGNVLDRFILKRE